MVNEVKEVITFWNNPITLIAAGAIIGFITSSAKDFITHYVQSKKAKSDLSLKQLDELFLLLFKNSNMIRKTLPTLLSNLPAKDDFDDSGARLGFIIRVYFPRLLNKYQEYLKVGSEFHTYQISLAKKYAVTSNLSSAISEQDYQKKHIAFETLYSELCTLIVEEAKKYE